MVKTNVYDRISIYLQYNPTVKRILVHPDDVDEIIGKKLYTKFNLPFKIFGKPTTFGNGTGGLWVDGGAI